MSLRNDIMIFLILGFRSDIWIELQAPVIVHVLSFASFLVDMPMSALPALTIKKSAQDEGTIYCQSGTIAKFIAREHGRSTLDRKDF